MDMKLAEKQNEALRLFIYAEQFQVPPVELALFVNEVLRHFESVESIFPPRIHYVDVEAYEQVADLTSARHGLAMKVLAHGGHVPIEHYKVLVEKAIQKCARFASDGPSDSSFVIGG